MKLIVPLSSDTVTCVCHSPLSALLMSTVGAVLGSLLITTSISALMLSNHFTDPDSIALSSDNSVIVNLPCSVSAAQVSRSVRAVARVVLSNSSGRMKFSP